MNEDIDVERFVKDPKILIELCRQVIDQISAEPNDPKLGEKEAQLREIAKTIERLENMGVSVPDSLRGEKTSLAAELSTKKDSVLALKIITDGLEEMLRSLRPRVVPVVPNRTGFSKLRKRPRSGDGFQTPQTEIRDCLVNSLKELGGYAHCNDVIDVMAQKLRGKFLPGDLEPDKPHGVKWKHNAHWARLDLVNEGVLVKNSPRGFWQLSKGQR